MSIQTISKNFMKNLYKIFLILTFLWSYNTYAQQTYLRSIENAKKLETNKKEFVGKPLKYFLKHIKLEIKSIVPAPNKNLKEVNRLSFLFVPYLDYRNNPNNISEKPTRITVIFNQNWDLQGTKCYYNIKDCIEWTKEDEKNLRNLIVYYIAVI